MKRNKRILLYVPIMLGMFIFQSYSGGYTASNVAVSPSSGSCSGSGCHSSATEDASLTYMQLRDVNNNIISEYIPNTDYKVEIILKKVNGSLGNPKAGFHATILNLGNTAAGSFLNTPSPLYTGIDTIGGNALARHRSSSAGSFLSNDTITWTFNWTAPNQGTGTLKLNVVANDANGNGNAGGDDILYSTIQINEASTVGTSNLTISPIKISPNPSSTNLNLELPNNSLARLNVFNTMGQLVLNQALKGQKSKIDISTMPNGTYFILVKQGKNNWRNVILKRD